MQDVTGCYCHLSDSDADNLKTDVRALSCNETPITQLCPTLTNHMSSTGSPQSKTLVQLAEEVSIRRGLHVEYQCVSLSQLWFLH